MPHPVFTPSALAPERLDDVTVGRVELLARLVQRLRDVAATGARPHTLVVGPRGSGKTHLLGVVLHRARLDPAVDHRLAVAWIPEDALSIGSYDDLLVELARALDSATGDRARALRHDRDARGLERLLLEVADGRVLVLVLENLDRIFAAIGPVGQAALRGFVETASSVVLLASTPLLFSGVSSRHRPWYGSFDAEHLGDLTLAEGTELLRRAAREAGDDVLASYVVSSPGQARLRAVEHLAGGSPRLWHILSGCMSVETLDELAPAVEAMLDELAPYYQQRLWELPASEQKLVVELGRQPGAQTVSALADAIGMDNRGAATALGRLAEAGWVRGTKRPGTDRRSTWYELREPLLRHHLQYRNARGEPLRLIVEMLQTWYSHDERSRLLARAEPGSSAERHLVHALVEGPPPRFDAAWADRDPDQLLAAARLWIRAPDSRGRLSGSADLGTAVEAVVIAARGVVTGDASSLPDQLRGRAVPLDAQVAAAVRDQAGEVADRVGAGLRSLQDSPLSGDDADLLLLLSASWDARSSPALARDRLAPLLSSRREDHDHLTLAIRAEHAFWTGEAGDPATARDLSSALVDDTSLLLGAARRDTLLARQNHAHLVGEAGEASVARDLLVSVVDDMVRWLGADDRITLFARHDHATWVGEAGDPAAARDLFAVLVDDMRRVLGADGRATLSGGRHGHAYWVGRAGDPAAARELLSGLVEDMMRVLGPNHRATLSSRRSHAYWTGMAGDPATALGLFTAVVDDGRRVLGDDDPLTVLSRRAWLSWALRAEPDSTEETLDRVLKHSSQHAADFRVLLEAVLARGPRSNSWRTMVAHGMAHVFGGSGGEVLELFGDALAGEGVALARTPAELRPIVEALLEIDACRPV